MPDVAEHQRGVAFQRASPGCRRAELLGREDAVRPATLQQQRRRLARQRHAVGLVVVVDSGGQSLQILGSHGSPASITAYQLVMSASGSLPAGAYITAAEQRTLRIQRGVDAL